MSLVEDTEGVAVRAGGKSQQHAPSPLIYDEARSGRCHQGGDPLVGVLSEDSSITPAILCVHILSDSEVDLQTR